MRIIKKLFLKCKNTFSKVCNYVKVRRGKKGTKGEKAASFIKKPTFKKPSFKGISLKGISLRGFSLKGLNGKILTISVGTVILTVILLLVVTLPLIHSNTVEEVNTSQLESAERLRHTIDDYLQQLDRTNENLAEVPDLRRGEFGSVRGYIISAAQGDNKIHRISIYDDEGTEHIRTTGQRRDEVSSAGLEPALSGGVHNTGFFLGENNRPTIIISSPIFAHGSTTEIIGAVEVEYNLQSLWSYVYQYNSGSTGGAMILDSSGTTIGHRDSSYVYNHVNMAEDLPWATMGEFRGNISYEHNDSPYLAAYNKTQHSDWVVVIFQGEDEVLANVSLIMRSIIITALVVVLVAVIITLLFVTKTFSPLKKLDQGARNIASGDLTQTFEIQTKDEIGKLADSFNQMVSSLTELIGNLMYSAELTEGTAKELSIAANEAAMASQQIASTVEDVAKGAEDQTNASQRVVEKVNKVASMAKNIAEKSSMATKVNREMVESIDKNAKTMGELISALKGIIDGNIKVSDNIRNLENEAERIGKIITVVTDIAGQTNLLALNAAIEAARAGDAGRGFAVVADEVRKLSEETSNAATEIKKIIGGIQKQVSDTSTMVNIQSTEAQSQLEIIDEANKALELIGSTSQMTLEAILEINSKAQEQASEVDDVLEDSKQVAYVAEQTSASSEEVAATTEEQTASLEEITAATESLSNMANDLKDQVNKFKL